jgi:hypothetical protein
MAKTKLSYKKQLVKSLRTWPLKYWRKGLWQKFVSIITIIVLVSVGFMYGVAEWYIHSQSSIPLQMGVSFIPDYAESLGLNPQQTMSALLNIGVRQFRLTSYWSDIETAPGVYNFSQLDWEFAMAKQYHAKIILTVGLRQPRWPECHPANWINTDASDSTWQPQLETFMSKVINRYKDSPSLQSYQLENEYFLKGFGDCTPYDYTRSRLISEDNLLNRLDPHHPIIIGRSNNGIGLPIGQPKPNEFSVSIYKRVWDAQFTHRYFEYPFPAKYYAFMAGIQKIFTGKNMIIGELQAEAWPPHGKTIPEISLAEQNKSMNAKILKSRFQYGESTGMRQIELWGAEYWYYRKEILHDPSLWNVARQEFSTARK